MKMGTVVSTGGPIFVTVLILPIDASHHIQTEIVSDLGAGSVSLKQNSHVFDYPTSKLKSMPRFRVL